MGLFNKVTPEIKSAKLLGVREAHETMIFTTVNFTMYSFWVEYTNGATEVVECSPSNPNDKNHKERKLFEKLMAVTNATGKSTTDKAASASDASILDELQKLNELHTAGIIPDELFNKKKSVLVEQLAISSQSDDMATPNLTIVRANKRPLGEGKTSTFLDGIELDANVDDSISCDLDIGEHSICFKRAAVSSKKVRFSVVNGKKYKVIANPKVFSIEVQVVEE
ncbi:MAG: hypothetical protein E7429_06395 [Ruminococcaceae bacterium]|nr:hypothetical protein [Oscillospiraceae bacterium]